MRLKAHIDKALMDELDAFTAGITYHVLSPEHLAVIDYLRGRGASWRGVERWARTHDWPVTTREAIRGQYEAKTPLKMYQNCTGKS